MQMKTLGFLIVMQLSGFSLSRMNFYIQMLMLIAF